MSNPDQLVEVYNAGNELEARILGDILEKNGIPYLLRPRVSLPSAYSPAYIHGAVQIIVPEASAEEARELIKSVDDG